MTAGSGSPCWWSFAPPGGTTPAGHVPAAAEARDRTDANPDGRAQKLLFAIVQKLVKLCNIHAGKQEKQT